MATPLHEPAAAEVGRLLREARLARGEEIAAAAEELRVRPAYLEVLDHKQDLFEAKQEVENGSNPSIVASAREEIPVLSRHLLLARKALRSTAP